jgi:RNA polymerase sigma factor (sigma-70 family)
MRLRNRLASIMVTSAPGTGIMDNLRTYNVSEMTSEEVDLFEKKLFAFIKNYMLSNKASEKLIREENVEELMNDVLFGLIKAPYDDTQGIKFTTYLSNIVRNAWANQLKGEQRDKRILNQNTEQLTKEVDGGEGEMNIENPGLEQEPDFSNEAITNVFIEEMLSSLTPKEKQAFVFVKLQNSSLREAAEQMGTNAQTVKNCVDRAVQKLQTIINREDLR